MFELLLLAQVIQPEYVHLTPMNKDRVEMAIVESKRRSIAADPRISPAEISNILGLMPEYTKNPNPKKTVERELAF